MTTEEIKYSQQINEVTEDFFERHADKMTNPHGNFTPEQYLKFFNEYHKGFPEQVIWDHPFHDDILNKYADKIVSVYQPAERSKTGSAIAIIQDSPTLHILLKFFPMTVKDDVEAVSFLQFISYKGGLASAYDWILENEEFKFTEMYEEVKPSLGFGGFPVKIA